MTKIYFFADSTPYVGEFNFDSDVPPHVASFEIQDGMSTFAPRYALENGELVDKYVGKTDQEVAVILQDAERVKAEETAARLQA